MTVTVREATPDDVDAVVDTLTTAFLHDPLWGPAFRGEAKSLGALWRLIVTPGLRRGWVLVTPEVEAAALWIPPEEAELTPEEEAELPAMLTDVAGPEVAADVLGIFDALANAHPHGEPHYFLSLLGTHDQHRGHGYGMALLAASLERIDREGMPAYLESSNPEANDARYARLGFAPIGEIVTAQRHGSGHRVTTMWRDAR